MSLSIQGADQLLIFTAFQGTCSSQMLLDTPSAYTGLPVVRVTQKRKGLSWVVLNFSVSGNFFKSAVLKTI